MQGVLLQAALMVWAAPPPWEANFFKAPPQDVLAAAAAVAVPARSGVDVLWRDVAYTFDQKGRQTTTSRLVLSLIHIWRTWTSPSRALLRRPRVRA